MSLISALDHCPTGYVDCSAILPDLVQGNCLSVGVELIDSVLITPADAPGFTDVQYADATALAAAITARLKQIGQFTTLPGYTGDAAMRQWSTYDATKPFVEPVLVTARPGFQVSKRGPKTIEGADYDNSLVNHQWHQKMNCYKAIRIWYLAGEFMYGGKSGIITSFNSWHGIVDSNDRPSEGFNYRLTYQARLIEDKCARPSVL